MSDSTADGRWNPIKIGVGVEGPSDKRFWDKVLQRSFAGRAAFHVRQFNNRDKLIREAPGLLNTYRDAGYKAGIILLDLDDDPCVGAVLDRFAEHVRKEFRADTRAGRFLSLCVARRELEGWYLADSEAINTVIPGSRWTPEDSTDRLGERKLVELLRCRGRDYRNKALFADSIALPFDPARACQWSVSFRYFWEVVEGRVGSR